MSIRPQSNHANDHGRRGRSRIAADGLSVLASLAWLLTGPMGAHGQTAPDAHPNILLIMTDDQGYGDLGVHGNPKIKTPHLDRFASESVRLKNFYVSPVCRRRAPACSPAGTTSARAWWTPTWAERLMHPDEVTLAEILAAAGYRTGHLRQVAPG